MIYRPDEFSFSIHWRDTYKGSYPRPATPGFYAKMGWANEGEAEWLLPHLDYRDEGALPGAVLLDWSTFNTIIREAGGLLDLDVDRVLGMQNLYESERNARLQKLKAQRAKLDEQIKAMDA